MEKKCGIYKITNLINNKVYIGQSVNIYERWKDHKSTIDNCLIHKAIQKYGIENFRFEILFECPREMLNNWEQDIIALNNSYVGWENSWGYNMTTGGGSHEKSELAKKHISEGTKIGIKNMSEDAKKSALENCRKAHQLYSYKIHASEGHKGHKAWNKGIPISKEQKQKLSNKSKRKFKWITPEGDYKIMDLSNAHRYHPNWKIIEQIYDYTK